MDNAVLQEHYFTSQLGCQYFAHTSLQNKTAIVLFVHGIGDSSVSYLRFLHEPLLANYGVVVADLLGHGRSSEVSNYDFALQVRILKDNFEQLLKNQNCENTPLLLISHSMGSIIATELAYSNLQTRMLGFINIEGSVTQYGSFIADKVAQAVTSNQFTEFFTDFSENVIYSQLAAKDSNIRSYYASLRMCRPEAFKQSALEMHAISHALSGAYTNSSGQRYVELTLPTIYCYGKTMAPETLDFLKLNNQTTQYFPAGSHWVMLDCYPEFLSFILTKLSTGFYHG